MGNLLNKVLCPLIRKLSVSELRVVMSFPQEFVLSQLEANRLLYQTRGMILTLIQSACSHSSRGKFTYHAADNKSPVRKWSRAGVLCYPTGRRKGNCFDTFPPSFSFTTCLTGHFDIGHHMKHSAKVPQRGQPHCQAFTFTACSIDYIHSGIMFIYKVLLLLDGGDQ